MARLRVRGLREWRREAFAVLAFATAIAVVSVLWAASAARAAEPPKWVLTAIPSPTHIMTNTPRNEVQRLTVNATGGTFTLNVFTDTGGGLTAPIPYNATAAELQTAIENLPQMTGNISVTGGPGTGTPREYEVTYVGAPEALALKVMEPNSSGLEGGTASAVEVTRGVKPPQLIVTATNVGGEATDGSAITIGDVLPSWLTATKVVGFDAYGSPLGTFQTGSPFASMTCEAAPVVSCTTTRKVDSGDQLVVSVEMTAGSSPPPGAINHATVTGGGATEQSVEAPLAPDSTPVLAGPAPGSVFAAVTNRQAGAHPDVVTSFMLSTKENDEGVADPKDIRFDLPPGLVGSVTGMPHCTFTRVISALHGENVCPNDTMVGTAVVVLKGGNAHPNGLVFPVPVYNIAPSPGEPAAFGFDAVVLPARLDTSVLSDGNYGVRVTAPDIPESAQLLGATVTIWGVPSEHSGPGENGEFTLLSPHTWGGPNPGQSPVPLLTSPQQCAEPLVASMSSDAWTEPGAFRSEDASMGTLTGCDLVPFSSSFSFLPDTLEAGAPAGYTFDLNIPQHNEQNVLATSSLKDFKLELPEGVVVNPSAAWGLKACSDAQFYGPNHPSQTPAQPAECPREAQVGEVEVETPDLEHPLKGQVFLGTPECDPCTPTDAQEGKMVRLFVQLIGTGEAGIVVKLEGRGLIDQKTGRITTEFHGTPQVPFNRLHFVLEGGPRAVLANPRVCGPVKATGDLTPWNSLLASGEEGVVSDSQPFYELEINQNCFAAQFNPTLKAGTPNIQAGEYSPFTLAFGRSDHDQFFNGISLTMPPGLLGNIGSVTQCKEPEAAQGTCGAASLIGHVNVLTGPGTSPFLVSGGRVFLTEGYEGAPYGLSIVVPAVAGPYTLAGTTGHGTVVVRAKIQVDPIDAHLVVTSDPLPSMLDGIPLQLKVVDVTIDRANFTFNPTNCGKLAIGASISSTEGMSANTSSAFQVTNCAKLGFKPSFKVSTAGKTSRANGASLDVKLAYPKAAFGSQANIAKVKVDLPKQLPSRLTTLQKACPAATFNQNPAACPAGSRVGSATATTPIIPVALSGPAYFVSYGGAKFPELVVVLSGYGVTVQLHGETFISKAGITSSTFRQVPDVPIGTFELKLPEGFNSALAANGTLCTSKLKMPTAFTAQNGIVIHQSTPVTPTGCSKHKAKKPETKHKKK
jgi:hypothetical protein